MPFTPQEITQIIDEFLSLVGSRQYIGARYVPIFGRKGESSIEWDDSAPYEPLTIVLHQGNSYTSRQYVPAGIDITDTEFWASTGTYNAQIEAYRQEVVQFDGRITSLEDSMPSSAFSSSETVKDYIDTSVSAIADVLPATEFTTAITVRDYIDGKVSDLYPVMTGGTWEFKGLLDFFRDESADPDMYSVGGCAAIGSEQIIFGLRGNRDGVVDNGGSIWLADLTTYSATMLTRANVGHANGLAYDAENAVLYVSTANTTILRYRYNVVARTLTQLADLTPNLAVSRIACDPTTGTLYGWIGTGTEQYSLVEIDKNTGDCRVLLNVPDGYRGIGNGLAAYKGIVYVGSGDYLSGSLTGFDVGSGSTKPVSVRTFAAYFTNGLLCRELQDVSFDAAGNLFADFAAYGGTGSTASFVSFGSLRPNGANAGGITINRPANTVYVNPAAPTALSNGTQAHPYHTIEPVLYYHPQVNYLTINLEADYPHKMVFSQLLDAKTYSIRNDHKVIAGMQVIGGCDVKVYYAPIFKPTSSTHLTDNAIVSGQRCGGIYLTNATFDTSAIQPTYLVNASSTSLGIQCNSLVGTIDKVKCVASPYQVTSNLTVV